MADTVLRQDRIGWNRGQRAIAVLDWRLTGQIPEMCNLGMGENQLHPRHGPRGLEITDREGGTGEGRAQHVAMQLALGPIIGGIAALAREEALVFHARERLAHTEFHWTHVESLAGRCRKLVAGQFPRVTRRIIPSRRLSTLVARLSPAQQARRRKTSP